MCIRRVLLSSEAKEIVDRLSSEELKGMIEDCALCVGIGFQLLDAKRKLRDGTKDIPAACIVSLCKFRKDKREA